MSSHKYWACRPPCIRETVQITSSAASSKVPASLSDCSHTCGLSQMCWDKSGSWSKLASFCSKVSKQQAPAQQLLRDGAAPSPVSGDRTSQRKMQQGQVEICETLRYSISVFFALSDYIFFLLQPRDGKASLHFVVWVCIFSGHLSFWLRTRWPHASNMSCRILRYLFRIFVVVVVIYNSKVQGSFF